MSSEIGRRRFRRVDVVDYETVENLRKKFCLKKGELAELMGISHKQYNNCEKKNGFLSFRVYAAIDAIENAALSRAMKDVATLHKFKSGLKLFDADKPDDASD
jgi:DNA-binding XRE family transcriptional regulator